MFRRSAIALLASGSAAAFLWCSPFEDAPGEALESDAASTEDANPSSAADAAAQDPNPVDPEGEEPPPPGPTSDGGCSDAAFSESFGADFSTRWSTTLKDGGAFAIDGTYVVTPPSALHAKVAPPTSAYAYATRSVCPVTVQSAKCTFSLRIDASTAGDVGIFDLRGTTPNGYGVARLKARELMYLSPDMDGGQRVDRATIPLIAPGAFHTVELDLDPKIYSVKIDGALVATMAVPAAGLTLSTVRAGITYQAGALTAGWDVRIDELSCQLF